MEVSDIPLVSVLMPVYNAAQCVKEAINSILSQTLINFELLIFNDGSTDDSSDIIKGIRDERIIFFDSKENLGYVAHLNNGLHLAKGKYIARMDADDIALPERFARQVALLESEPNVGLCGTRYQTFGTYEVTIPLPLEDQAIREFMLEHCPMGHPTVMFRKAIVERHQLTYNKQFMPAEDYKLWYDFSKVSELRNLPEVLLRYRVHPNQISAYKNEIQRAHANTVRVLQLIDNGFHLTLDEQQLYCRILDPTTCLAYVSEFYNALALMRKIIIENTRLKAYRPDVFPRIFSSCWHNLICNIRNFTPAHILPVLISEKPIKQKFNLLGKIRFVLKCTIFWKTSSLG